MKKIYLTTALIAMTISANSASDKATYIQALEKENGIKYNKIDNTYASYITSMCYTKTKDNKSGKVFNPCYSCHTNGKEPNYIDDADLQASYNFPTEILNNPFKNLFKDRSKEVGKISDKEILDYINQSNYFDADHTIALAKNLPKDWHGYRPDCYYNFDKEGFDHSPDGNYTGWRAFRYYPFLGTFWPTNGSTDDVLIRLSKPFRMDKNGKFDKNIYKLNLSIVEAIVKQKDIKLPHKIDESLYGVDLNQDGKIDMAQKVVFDSSKYFTHMSYVGAAKKLLKEHKVHLAGGLFPEGTEFLHSVRYVGWDDKQKHIKMANRFKELRYAKKLYWSSYSELLRDADAELREQNVLGTDQTESEVWYGDYEHGIKSGTGWIYQGFIEDKKGALRPQTYEETIGCMGCHAGVGAPTDTIISFPRKFEGIDMHSVEYGWNHWSQKSLIGVPEPKVSYKGYGKQYEYSFYLLHNPTGNEFRDNMEVRDKFFDKDGKPKEDMFNKLHKDISVALLPSLKRALQMDKGYKVLVGEQSFIYGREGNAKPIKNVYKKIDNYHQSTGIEKIILHDN